MGSSSLVSTTFTATSSTTLTFSGMPSCTVVGVELWDNTPTRKWFGPLAANKVVNSGDIFSIASGSLAATIANS
jgi:hypothetical protein